MVVVQSLVAALRPGLGADAAFDPEATRFDREALAHALRELRADLASTGCVSDFVAKHGACVQSAVLELAEDITRLQGPPLVSVMQQQGNEVSEMQEAGGEVSAVQQEGNEVSAMQQEHNEVSNMQHEGYDESKGEEEALRNLRADARNEVQALRQQRAALEAKIAELAVARASVRNEVETLRRLEAVVDVKGDRIQDVHADIKGAVAALKRSTAQLKDSIALHDN